jgi:amidohydrolase
MTAHETIVSAIDARAAAVAQLARRIHANPELKFEEKQASVWLADAVEQAGVKVERGVGGLPTAFRARIGRGGGARVAILAEYDALPEIGHACGHNLIAGGAIGAFLGLASMANDLGGEVLLLGTPGEEGGGGKIKLLEAGAFEGVDAAMMFHPLDRDLLAHASLASEWLTFSFKGRPSHAAASPWDGYSALSAVIQTFNLIDSQRVHFRDGSRVHGFITNGGQAVNIIPEHAACQFSVRATRVAYLAELVERVQDCARAAALATRVELAIDRVPGYRDMKNNMALARAFGDVLAGLGRRAKEADPELGAGSTDMGDVSHQVPAIHPYLAICARGETTCHEHAFAAHAASDQGMAAMLDAARAMALTTQRFLSDADLRDAVRAEFDRGG